MPPNEYAPTAKAVYGYVVELHFIYMEVSSCFSRNSVTDVPEVVGNNNLKALSSYIDETDGFVANKEI